MPIRPQSFSWFTDPSISSSTVDDPTASKSPPSIAIQNRYSHFSLTDNPRIFSSFPFSPRFSVSPEKMAATAALQQGPGTFVSRCAPSIRNSSVKPANLLFSGGLRLPKLVVLKQKHRRSVIRMASLAAGSYATALADVATSNGTLEATAADLEKLDKLFSDQSVVAFFVNPVVSEEQKREIIDQIASGGNVQTHVANFLNVLLDNKRIDLIKEIIEEFEQVYNKLTDTELAVVTSVVKLEPQHMAQIAKQVQKLTGAQNVRIKTVIDESLVAGFTIRFSGSKLIDMSVKKQLEEIAAQLEIGDVPIPV